MKVALFIALATLLVEKLSNLPTRQDTDAKYDFIVVGSGPAGSVVASRLSEDRNVKVLLLEAGETDTVDPRIKIPMKSSFLQGTAVDWQYETVPQKHSFRQYPNRVGKWARGKVIGGTSSLNYHAWARGSPHDFDSWVDHGAIGWGYNDVESYFRRVENATTDDMSRVLGRDGLLKLTTNRFDTPVSNMFRKASEEIGIKNVDYNDELEGLSFLTGAIYDGIRQNAATAYLYPFAEERKDSLHILTGAQVSRVLTIRRGSGDVVATGVEYLRNGKVRQVLAKKEVILCGGVIGTPQILLLSGIGPKKHLDDLGIPVAADLPGVGSNLQEHLVYAANFKATGMQKVEKPKVSPEIQYIMEGNGPLADLPYMAIHIKSSLSGTPKSLSTKKRPFPELHMYIIDASARSEFVFTVNHNHAKSRGTIRLRSTNPEDHPIIDPMFYSNEDDFIVQMDGFRIMEMFENSEAFKEINATMVMPKFCNGSANTKMPRSQEFYRCVLEELSQSGNHQCCTAKIGPPQDNFSVVDSKLRVYGIRGLRVADASVMPHLPSSHTQAPCYMIGEKAADMIKKTWRME